MAVTLSTFGRFVSGTTPVANNGTLVVDSATLQVVTLPASSTTPVGFKFLLVRDGVASVEIRPAGADVVTGLDNLTTDGECAWIVNRESGVWLALLAGLTS